MNAKFNFNDYKQKLYMCNPSEQFHLGVNSTYCEEDSTFIINDIKLLYSGSDDANINDIRVASIGFYFNSDFDVYRYDIGIDFDVIAYLIKNDKTSYDFFNFARHLDFFLMEFLDSDGYYKTDKDVIPFTSVIEAIYYDKDFNSTFDPEGRNIKNVSYRWYARKASSYYDSEIMVIDVSFPSMKS